MRSGGGGGTPSALVEGGATSCEGQRRVRLLLRTRGGCAKPNHVCSVSLHQRPRRRSQRPPFRATRAAHQYRPPASGQQAQPLKPLQAAPARKPIASRSRRFRPQAKRGGIRGAAMVLAQIGCTRSPFGFSPRVGKNAPHIHRWAREPAFLRKKPRPRPSDATRSPSARAGKPSVPPCKKHADVV